MIKRTLILFLILVFLNSVNAGKKVDYIILYGKIENPNSGSLSIRNFNRVTLSTIKLGESNIFRDTIRVSEGYYYIYDGKEQTQVYLKPGFVLDFSLNTKAFDESIIYKGKGADENNYLAKKALLNEGFGKYNYYGYYGKLNEKDFLRIADSLHSLNLTLFNKNKKTFDSNFAFLESKSLEFEMLEKLSGYESTYRFVAGDKSFNVSSDFPNPFANIDLTNEKLLLCPGYITYIESYLNTLVKDEMKGKDSLDMYLCFMRKIGTEISNPKIKEELSYNVGKWRLSYTKELDKVYEKINSFVTNKAYLEEVNQNYQKLKKIEKGAISPGFKLMDINGNLISLEKLKGKIVYIDIWATWCLPCIKEIPALKELEEIYKEKSIQFVSICQNDTKDKWEAMVKEKELGGIQIFAPDSKISFFTDYLIQGIPHFIILDKEGRIIESNAKRPSDPKLKEQLNKLL